MADEALLDERLQDVEMSLSDFLRSLERAPAAEDCERCEQPALLCVQQLV